VVRYGAPALVTGVDEKTTSGMSVTPPTAQLQLCASVRMGHP
jgi:hypothetical protein